MSEMDNNELMTEAADDTIFPDGWTEDSDIFDLGEPLGDNLFPEMEAEDISDDDIEAVETDDEAPTTEQSGGEAGYEADGETAPTTETEPQEAPVNKKLKFKAKVDHNDIDVELDEADLPTVYQKAQATDRVQAKLAKYGKTMDIADKLAAAMDYSSSTEMLQAAADNYRQNLINDLLDSGTPQAIAEDYVNRKMGDLMALIGGQSADEQTSDPVATPAPETAPTRDFDREAAELISIRPELRGHNLPEEVTRDAVVNGRSLLAAYMAYESKQKTAEIETLRKENRIYKQNAEAASRAPVSGTSGGGATDTKPSDPFLEGFSSAW